MKSAGPMAKDGSSTEEPKSRRAEVAKEVINMTFRDLSIWKKSMDLVDEVYIMVKKLPKEETYALSDQIRRAAVSIPSNIAEGFKRNSDRDFIHFLSISNGSIAELETQIEIAVRQEMISQDDATKAINLCNETGKMLSSFIGTLKKRLN